MHYPITWAALDNWKQSWILAVELLFWDASRWSHQMVGRFLTPQIWGKTPWWGRISGNEPFLKPRYYLIPMPCLSPCRSKGSLLNWLKQGLLCRRSRKGMDRVAQFTQISSHNLSAIFMRSCCLRIPPLPFKNTATQAGKIFWPWGLIKHSGKHANSSYQSPQLDMGELANICLKFT